MRRKTIKQLDEILYKMSERPNFAWQRDILHNDFPSVSETEFQYLISSLLSDGHISSNTHPSAPHVDFGIYVITTKGVRFIKIEGGYKAQQRIIRYENNNVIFTLVRHWIWMVMFFISFGVNVYLLLFQK